MVSQEIFAIETFLVTFLKRSNFIMVKHDGEMINQHSLLSSLFSAIMKREADFIDSLGYKASYTWALRTIEILSLLIVLVATIQYLVDSSTKSVIKNGDKKESKSVTLNFRLFQAQYLSVYLVVMLADWLQGTNMYTLYTSYNVDVGTLFLTGFLSSAIFGTFLGVYVDKWGRKLGCVIFCILEVIINVMEHVPSMPILMLGRILGGISTSLLFSAFESWMVTEHRRRGFHEDLLSSTFAISSWGSAVSAICAGFLAQVSADLFGDIGPFQLAIALTLVALVLIVAWWGENYGEDENATNGNTSTSDGSMQLSSNSVSIWESMKSSMRVIWHTPAILYLGLSQAFFEGAVYTFVFMWVPSLQTVFKANSLSTDELPIGLVFSCFMLAMTIGGMAFGALLPIFPGGANGLCIFTYVVAAMAMFTPVMKFTFPWVFTCFLVLEAMVGMFNSCGAQLRSEYYPGDRQSSIMTVFRVPLNLLVVLGTNAANYANDVPSMQLVFGLIVAMLLVASHLQVALAAVGSGSQQREISPSTAPSPEEKSKAITSDELLSGMVAKKEKEIIGIMRMHVSELVRLEMLVNNRDSINK